MKDPSQVLRQINELQCTVYFSVPSLLIYFQTLKMINSSSFAHIRSIIFGGEGYPKTRLKELYNCLHSRVELVNVYGPTECTCICSAYRISQDDLSDLDSYAPLGGPIANFSFWVLTERGEKAAAGELYLGGPSVGLGYFHEPDLTRNAFVQNPLNNHYEERLYRTGDMVCVSKTDGKVYFVGRKDTQIKHQGYRIELGEIEHALRRIAGVDEAIALHTTRNGVSLIIGVVASGNGVQPDLIRHEIAKAVPAYMVPGRIDVVKQLPRNANGKVDRRLLQERYC
jgi:acyl-coenzyme A synthetase/AMP-(fatty) acid ligase